MTGITQSMVGLSNVNNTTDTREAISTATQAGLDAKAPLASPTFTGTVTGITQSMVRLSNVNNTTDALKPISTATQNALNTYQKSLVVSTPLLLNATTNALTIDVTSYQKALSVIYSATSPLTLNSTSNALTIDLLAVATYVQNTGVFQKAITVTSSALLPLVWNSVTNTLAIDLSAFYRTAAGLFATLYSSGTGLLGLLLMVSIVYARTLIIFTFSE